MSNISIASYTIGIKNKNDDESYSLNNIDGLQFIDIFDNFITENNQIYENNEVLEKIFKFEGCIQEEKSQDNNCLFNYIIGRIKTGSYGQEAEIINSTTGNFRFNKNEDDAEVMPFNFILAIPPGEVNRGILILQKNGIFGIKTLFEKILSDYLKTVSLDYKLFLGNVAPMAYLEKLFEYGVLQRIRFFRYEIPNDIGNQIGLLNNGVNESYEEYVINKPTGFIRNNIDRIRECIRGQRNLATIVQLNNFEYENIKLEFKLGAKYKTINLSDVSSISFNDDITNLVTLNGGHPTVESMQPILIETAMTYLEEMGLIVRG
ncbi:MULTISPECIES: hypothetical protein [unclassified Sedimentibacter]|uniref:hypothetical protein n=1 Tax=unclassified Sedimentibacter TaxID=2649220 RepID=UPI0027DF5140|nr:hypothetical protein [Sedimentibacter sp. MB35-C1]WMJ78467.1 hypothetical protein RBQ61_05975 [Sedimentibacter sp. MB35-C1]